jgi:hypothetical protein
MRVPQARPDAVHNLSLISSENFPRRDTLRQVGPATQDGGAAV